MLGPLAIAIGLLKMLLELQASKRTGALGVAGPAARVRLFVDEGRVVFADEGTVGETLGRLLVHERVLTQEQYGATMEWLATSRASGKKTTLAEALVELGMITVAQLHAALVADVDQKIVRALGWPSPRFKFFDCFGPLELANRFLTPIEPLLVAALRLADRERVDELLAQARERYPILRSDSVPGGGSTKTATMARLAAFRFSSAEDELARSLDGSRPVRELLADENSRGVDRAVIVSALLLTDTLDLQAAPSNAPAPTGREPATIVDAPPPSMAPVSMAPMAPLLAEKAFQTGKQLVRQNRLEEAIEQLRRAMSLYPAAEYALWAAWAAARADVDFGHEKRHKETLRAAAELALEENAEHGFATFVLATLAWRAGEKRKAHELFERARILEADATQATWDPPANPTPTVVVGASTTEANPDDAAVASAPAPQAPMPAAATPAGAVGEVATLRGIAAAAAMTDVKARLEVEAEAKAKAEIEARARAYAEARAKAKVEAEATATADAKAKAEAEATATADAKAKAEAEARAKAGAEEAEARAKAEAEEAEATATAAAVAVPADAAAKVQAEVEVADVAVAQARLPTPTSARSLEPTGSRSVVGWGFAVVAVGVAGYLATRSPPAHPEAVITPSRLNPGVLEGQSPSNAPSVVASSEAPTATSAPSTSVTTSAASTTPTPSAKPPSEGLADASYDASSQVLPEVDATRGVLVMPRAADTHRVYVDGRLAGVPPAPIVVGCGRHVVKIGSMGREQTVLVPCGGNVTVAYP